MTIQVSAPAAPPLRGRDPQLHRIDTVVDELASTGRGRTVIVHGAARSGRTALLEHAAELAERRGLAVRRASVDPRLPTPAPDQAAVGPARTDARPARPTVVLLDDIDAGDRDALDAVHALVRSSWRGVVWVIAARTRRDERSIDRLVPPEVPVDVLPRLGALEPDDIEALVADLTGAQPSPEVRGLAESLGRPGTVTTMVRGLLGDGDLVVDDGVVRLRESLGGGDAAAETLPARFRAHVAEELGAMSGEVRRLLQVAAVLGPEFAPDALTTMLKSSPAELLCAFDEVLRCGLVVTRIEKLAFRTDALWRAVLATLPEPMRLVLHRQAARMMLEHFGDRGAAAMHVARGAVHGDPTAIALLDEVSADLVAEDPGRAADLAMRGLRLTEDERCAPGALATTAVQALSRRGDPEQAVRLGTALLDGEQVAPDQRRRMRGWVSTAHLLRGDAEGAAGTLVADGYGDEYGDGRRDDVAEVVRLSADSLVDGVFALPRARALLADADDRSDPGVLTAARCVVAVDHWREGRPGAALEALAAAPEGFWFHDHRWLHAALLVRVGRLDEADGVLAALAEHRRAGDRATTVTRTVLRATLALARGELADARSHAENGLRDALRCGMPLFAPQAAAVITAVALHEGDLAGARAGVARLEEVMPPGRSRPWWATRRLAALQVALADDPDGAGAAALADLHADPSARRELVLEDPSVAPWLVRLALAGGDHDTAAAVVDLAEALSADEPTLEELGWAFVHARGLVRGDPADLARAAAGYATPTAAAYAVEDHAAALAASDPAAAVDRYDEALRRFEAMGASRHTARVNKTLRSMGVRRRHWRHVKRPDSGWASLTDTERRVAELVADGLTNRQAASQLFVSAHTVGFHLRQVYRKLGVRSRTELARLERHTTTMEVAR